MPKIKLYGWKVCFIYLAVCFFSFVYCSWWGWEPGGIPAAQYSRAVCYNAVGLYKNKTTL